MGKPDETTKRWLDPASVTPRVGIYPAPFVAPLAGREKRALAIRSGSPSSASTSSPSVLAAGLA
jgi:hypothetical protein